MFKRWNNVGGMDVPVQNSLLKITSYRRVLHVAVDVLQLQGDHDKILEFGDTKWPTDQAVGHGPD